MGTLSGKTALVTGSSRGIGKAIAERFGKLGADVVVNFSARKEPALTTVEAIEKSGVRAIAIQADLAMVDDIAKTRPNATDLTSSGRIRPKAKPSM
jgi:3-oxoacyl-[acyl-carrier protein] reductase